jgi:hypothetical protein
MKKVLVGLSLFVLMAVVVPAALYAQPEVPTPPADGSEVMGFLEALRAALIEFLTGLIGTSPI